MKSNCGTCGWQGVPTKGLGDIPDLYERLSPGGTVPSGECPNCQALCYPVKEHRPSIFDTDFIIPFTLVDGAKQGKSMTHSVRGVVRINGLGVGVSVEGYGDAGTVDGQGEPVFIEFYNGRLVVRCYADINQEDPTHLIDMEGALESARNQEVTR